MHRRYRRLWPAHRPARDCLELEPRVLPAAERKLLQEAGVWVLPDWALDWVLEPPADRDLRRRSRRRVERIVRDLLGRELRAAVEAIVGDILARRNGYGRARR
jgi:hypothetical protein